MICCSCHAVVVEVVLHTVKETLLTRRRNRVGGVAAVVVTL